MPVSRRTADTDVPERLRPYLFHGLDLAVRGGQAFADCPFCGKDGKFTVNVETSKFRCFVCGTTGNALEFVRLWHAALSAATTAADLARIAQDRRLLQPDTLLAWGVCVAPGATWCVPGYAPDGRLDQLYRRTWVGGAWRLLPTPGLWPDGKAHALHLPVASHDPGRPRVDVFEGPWDGMAMWEVASSDDTTIIAVPGCCVWRDEWSDLCRGKHVTLWYDSDHPIPEALKRGQVVRPGLDGMCRVARRLSGIAASVRFVRWGPEGYDAARPSGWDVRDHLVAGDAVGASGTGRRAALLDLVSRVEDVPASWLSSHPSANGRPYSADVEPELCHDWDMCEAAWQEALEWRQDLGDALAVMLAVAASTNQAGDNQLFLQVIGDPGSAKTRLCKGLLVSRHCKQVIHLKSFHSGWKGKDGEDCSFVARINGMCLVTPEADALYNGLNSQQIDSQVRQIFDGETANTYGNSSEDRHYKGLRCPWVQAGTPALMDRDQSRLGDRFVRVRIGEPPQALKRAIMMRSLRNECQAVQETGNGTEASIIPPKLRRAYALTGGFVDWLRTNVEARLATVAARMSEAADERCCDLAELVSDMRARPNMDPRKTEVHHSKELGSRLAGQFGRLALCLAVVLGRKSVDAEVMRVVRKVALDTAYGHTLNIVQWLCGPNPKMPGRSYQDTGGLMDGALAMWTCMTAERLANYMGFLRKIGIVDLRQSQGNTSWVLTERVHDLYLRVIGDD